MDRYCGDKLPFSSRQARDYTVLVRAFGSIEEMLKVVPEGSSFANAVLVARARLNPGPEAPTADETPDGDDGPVTIEPGDDGRAALRSVAQAEAARVRPAAGVPGHVQAARC